MFVDKDGDGHIVGLYAVRQFPGQPFIPNAELWTDPKLQAKAAILERERAEMLPRVTREFMLSVSESLAVDIGAKQGMTKEQSLELLAARNVGYVKVKALDEEISILRAKVADR